MILILSQNHIEEPTNRIIDWLLFNKANFVRINGDQFSIKSDIYFNVGNTSIKYNNGKIDTNEINVVWYRRWNPMRIRDSFIDYVFDNGFNKEEVNLFNSYNKYLNNEYGETIKFFFNLFSEKKSIPNITKIKGNLNKLTVLNVASKIGLKIPETIITNSKKDVFSFLEKNSNIITKPISEVSILTYKNEEIRMLTKELSSEDVMKMPDFFFPTLFQKAIDKTFEIRIFFIENFFYSMAIFSQTDKETSSDFRNYNYQMPNRCIPFNVPNNIMDKLKRLMVEIELNTGSIDLIYNEKNDEYIFLEVNPVGQFGMVSDPCNYNIEKKIAEILRIYDEK